MRLGTVADNLKGRTASFASAETLGIGPTRESGHNSLGFMLE
jgi:hypothetical protein